MADEKADIAVGSRIQIHRQENGWRVEVIHKAGGISGRLAPFQSLDEVLDHLKETYDIE